MGDGTSAEGRIKSGGRSRKNTGDGTSVEGEK